MRIFKCDKCGKEFPEPLDVEQYKDEHGVLRSYDLCAPCRGKLGTERDKTHKTFFEKLKK